MVGKPDKALRSLGHVLHRPVIGSSLAACYRAVRSRLTSAVISLPPSSAPPPLALLLSQVPSVPSDCTVGALSISSSAINENHFDADVAVRCIACPECSRAGDSCCRLPPPSIGSRLSFNTSWRVNYLYRQILTPRHGYGGDDGGGDSGVTRDTDVTRRHDDILIRSSIMRCNCMESLHIQRNIVDVLSRTLAQNMICLRA